MKKIDKKYKIVILLFIIALLLGTINITVKKERNLTIFESAIKDSVLFISDIVFKPINYVKDKIDEKKVKDNLYEKYKDLENRIEYTESLEAKLKTYEDEIKKLKDTLELNTILTDYLYLNATIVNRNIGYWYDTITIDKGSKNGVKIGQAVINNSGLIGRVINTSNFNSTIKLLTASNTNNKMSVEVLSNDKVYYGLLSGYDKESNTFIVEGISSSSKIKIKDKVVTSGLGNNYPKGLFVGYVDSITTDNYDLGMVVKIKPNVDYNDIEYVTIVTKRIVE